MANEDIQNLNKIVNDLREKVSEFIGKSEAKDEKYDEHIAEDKQWKEKMGTELHAIANALLQDQSREEGQTETKTKLAEHWKWAIVVIVTLLAGNFIEVMEKLSQIFLG